MFILFVLAILIVCFVSFSLSGYACVSMCSFNFSFTLIAHGCVYMKFLTREWYFDSLLNYQYELNINYPFMFQFVCILQL
jgi:hypothetical protein